MLNTLAKKDSSATGSMLDRPSLWRGPGEIEQMFDRLFHGFDLTLPAAGWRAPLAVCEDEQQFEVEIELAGVGRDDVSVTVDKRQLVISYERKIPEGRTFTYNERGYGQFERRLALPDTVDVDSIQADLRDGLLQLKLAKKAEAQPRRIAIQAG